MDDSFVFYRSFFEALSFVPEEEYAACVKAIINYGLNGEDDAEGNYAKMILAMAKPVLDSNQKRRANGKKGGRPSKDTNGYEEEKPMVTEKKTNGYEDEKPMDMDKEENAKPYEDEDVDEDVHEEKDEEVHADEERHIPAGRANRKRATKHKHGEYQHVLLTDDEMQKLLDSLGNEKASHCIRFLDEYKERKGYKCKSDYLTILKWVVKAVDEEESEKRKGTTSPNDTGHSGRLDWIDKAVDEWKERYT